MKTYYLQYYLLILRHLLVEETTTPSGLTSREFLVDLIVTITLSRHHLLRMIVCTNQERSDGNSTTKD